MCLTITAKISMYCAPSSLLFAIGFMVGLWLIVTPIKYSELVAFDNSTYINLFNKSFWITKLVIAVSSLNYLETIFPLTTMVAFKNSIINTIIPTQLNLLNSSLFNYFYLFLSIGTIYYLTYRFSSTFNAILATGALIMVFSMGYFVNIGNFMSYLMMHSDNSFIGMLLSFIDGIVLSLVATDICTFLSATVYEDFKHRINHFSFEEKKQAYATYVICIAILATFVFAYITICTLDRALIELYNQVDSDMLKNTLCYIIVSIYKVASLWTMTAVMHILYRETIVLLKILNQTKKVNVAIVVLFLALQSLIAISFSYQEIAVMSSALYLIIQISMSIAYITRKPLKKDIKQEHIQETKK